MRKKTLSKRTNQFMDLFTLCVGYMSLSTDRGVCRSEFPIETT